MTQTGGLLAITPMELHSAGHLCSADFPAELRKLVNLLRILSYKYIYIYINM